MTSYDHELFVADKGMAEIEAKIVAQGDKIRELKAAKAAKDAIQPEVSFWLRVFFSCQHFTNAGGCTGLPAVAFTDCRVSASAR